MFAAAVVQLRCGRIKIAKEQENREKKRCKPKKQKNGGKEIMNKKRLSVVMAGAMLASSVAPVLAAEGTVEKTEISKANIGLIVDEISRKIQAAPVFSEVSNANKVDTALEGKSVYGIQIDNAEPVSIEKKDTLSLTQKEVKDALKTIKVGNVVKLVNLGYAEEKSGTDTLIISRETKDTYTEEELKSTGNDSVYKTLYGLANNDATKAGFNSIVKDYKYVDGEGFVITLQDDVTFYGSDKKLVLTTETGRLDFANYYAAADKKSETAFSNSAVSKPGTNFHGFKDGVAKNVDIANKVEKEYTIKSGGDTFELSDLYDGLMLTEKGQALLNDAKDALAITGDTKLDNIVKVVDANAGGNTDLEKDFTTITKDEKGVYSVELQIADSATVSNNDVSNVEYKSYFITSKDKVALIRVLEWFNNVSADVDKLAGENRYATAVRIAKEVAGLKSLTVNSGKYNIVLVNGNSLVDGLAAAPLAKHLAGSGNAPILLTESDELPRATKAYLQELLDEAKNKDVIVSIVGGDAVVSNSVVRELKDMNLKVKRYGGANREATSMAVAEEIGIGAKGAFVVGADGEADAMSVAGYAAANEMPVIVSSYKGLSEDTLQELDGNIVKVIGGEKAISESDFEAIKEVTNRVERISGSNRKATNAAVINKFYTGEALNQATKSVIVAKDDVLIDALTASNLSAVHNSPIVLATKSLTDDQLNAVVKNANSSQKVKKVYQVGGDVAVEVVKTIAETLGLA